MIQALKQSEFNGTIGVIGHTEGEDIKNVLIRNIDGLRTILREFRDAEALKTNR